MMYTLTYKYQISIDGKIEDFMGRPFETDMNSNDAERFVNAELNKAHPNKTIINLKVEAIPE